jgi:hypothetical protein
MNRPSTEILVCPTCSAEYRALGPACFLCGLPIAGAFAKRAEGVETASHRSTFRLSSMMLVIALIAVFLGLWHENPSLAVWYAIPALMALIYTVSASGKRESSLKQVRFFLVTFAAVVGAGVAGVAASVATCLAVAESGEGLSRLNAGLISGGITGLAVAILLLFLLLRASRRRRIG